MRRQMRAITLLLVMTLAVMGLSGCSAAKSAFKKLNDRLSDEGTAPAALSEELVRDPQVKVASEGVNSVTVLVYMNGSNLESESGEASEDIKEMLKSKCGDNVKVVIQTMGTSKWQDYGISSKRTQRYLVDNGELTLMDGKLKQLACTESSTLRDFVTWGAANYPADRYELIFWDHGAGPVYGFGYDETGDEDDTLTLDEIRSALKDAGIYFDFIGMDCCIMSSLETCCALYDFCDFTILSEDFESGLGWYYTDWLAGLEAKPDMSTKDLGTMIVDGMVKANKKDKDNGDKAILSVVDESMMKVLFTAWTDFAYANENALLGKNYSTSVKRASGGRDSLLAAKKGMFSNLLEYGLSNFFSDEEVSMADYYVTDIMATASTVDSEESKALSAALKDAIVYTNSYNEEASLTGLSVSLPYGDEDFYKEMKQVFTNCGIDQTYIKWLGRFVSASGTNSYQDYSSFENSWSGWDTLESLIDWYLWEDEHDTDAINNNTNGWNQHGYENSWNAWYEENYENYQNGSGNGPNGFGGR